MKSAGPLHQFEDEDVLLPVLVDDFLGTTVLYRLQLE